MVKYRCTFFRATEAASYSMDVVCYLSSIKRGVKLSKVAHLVFTLPHSNAEEERVFTMVTNNKTKDPT